MLFWWARRTFCGFRERSCQIYIWHRYLGSLLEVLSGHASTVNAVGWPVLLGRTGSSLLVSASDDHTVRLWGTEAQLQALSAGKTPKTVAAESKTTSSRVPGSFLAENSSSSENEDTLDADHQLGRNNQSKTYRKSKIEFNVVDCYFIFSFS